jgi:hypothetical protein
MIATERTVSRWRTVLWVLVGVLIVAHGCHAGRDTELRIADRKLQIAN